ncbi:MAG: DASH family cryptochrome [Desulfofustis sp. PB-SRB1]|jgi:deoxyribodipyrimidine photo-lyase|nr:DASH family cryptochrome [Desulfofustis sp. PB-SRB1]HBH23917.1 DASH family cryptochrome [Cytophagales bacterium]
MSRSIIWFRNNLRLHDNAALANACRHDQALGLYCFDPGLFRETAYGFLKTGALRLHFILEALENLQEELGKLNIPLKVVIAKPEIVIPELCDRWSIDGVYAQKEHTYEELQVEKLLTEALPDKTQLHFTEGITLFNPEKLPFDLDKMPRVFTDVRKMLEKYGEIPDIVDQPGAREAWPGNEELEQWPGWEAFGLEAETPDERTAFPWRGDEKAALERLESYLWESRRIEKYKFTRNGLVGADYSSKFSPWLSIGALSPRMIYHEVKRYEQEVKKNISTYWLIFELIWRDFFRLVAMQHGSKIFMAEGIRQKPVEWSFDPEVFEKWRTGNTGDDFVDANMKELQLTGFMSNRGRQNVASYLAHDLKQDWRAGAAWFENRLIDYDVTSNWGNWMYVAGVGNDPRDRKFNTQWQAEKYDKNRQYRKLWLD